MRSQTKTSPKKGAVTKTTPKTSAISKQSKKKVSPKKVKSIANKTLGKGVKKTVSDKSDVTTSKSDGASTSEDKNDFSAETSKIASSKTTASRSNSPAKKTKKNSKKDAAKATTDVAVKKIIPKKQVKTGKKSAKPKIKKKESNADDVKYKINSDVAKKAPKFSKAKTVVKKGVLGNQKKKSLPVEKHEQQDEEEQKEEPSLEKEISNKNEGNNKKGENTEDVLEDKIDNKVDVKNEEKIEDKDFPISPTESSTSSTPSTNNSDTPKAETERPLKFFTSSRTPRTVDIDVKCCKTSKGSLSVSERFLSMKCEPKIEDNNKDKNSSNALVSQGAEIDVYTFTEKVDSPKSILTDFRSPIPKNVGRVRPIARVKGTIIDKKSDSEKKKYSPHRPIEEVVKQLKANKRTEELNASATQIPLSTSEIESVAQTEEKDAEEKPKPIVSKSYKMVARKSSVTGKPFSPIKFLDNDSPTAKTEKSPKTASPVASKKPPSKPKKQQKKPSISDEEIDTSKFSLSSTFHYTSSEESVGESNDDNDTKESSSSDTPKSKKVKNKKYKRITDSAKKPTTSKELKELSKDSLVDLKDNSLLMGEKPSKRRLKLLSMWTGPKKHRMASLNAMAKVHCLYENESRTHMELGLMKTVDRQAIPSTSTATPKSVIPKKKDSKAKDAERPMTSTSGSEYETKAEKKDESSESSDDNRPSRTLRGVPGIRSAGKYWDPKSSTSSSEDSELETKKKNFCTEKKKVNSKTSSATKSDTEKPPAKMKKTAGVPVKKQRKRTEVLMEFKDMVVQKRMASLNATAILAASYEKRSPKSSKDDTTSDSCSDESFSTKPKNGVSSGVKSEAKSEEPKKEIDETTMTDKKQKVEVIVNQDTDVTITGVYSTHHEGFCTAMQYRISSTSHTQTTATANCEKVRFNCNINFPTLTH